VTDTSYLRSIREQVVQRHIAAEEDGDVAAVLRTFAPGRVSYSGDTLGGDLIGDQAVGTMLTAGLAAMSDLKIEILRLHHAEDAVITELRGISLRWRGPVARSRLLRHRHDKGTADRITISTGCAEPMILGLSSCQQ